MKHGKAGAAAVAALVQDADNSTLSSAAREALLPLVEQLRHTEERVARLEQCIVDWHKSNPTSQRFASIPGIGPITASAIVATITDARLFSSGRHLAAWLGLVPRQNSSGGRERLGGITKKGDGYIRKLLVIGAMPFCASPERGARAQPCGQAVFCRGSRTRSSRWHWRTKWQESVGRSWRGMKSSA